MNTACPWCHKNLRYKLLTTRNFGEMRDGVNVSTPICKYCQKPLQVNIAPKDKHDQVFEFLVFISWVVVVFYSFEINSMLLGLVASFTLVISIFIYQHKTAHKNSMVNKYSKYE